MGVFYGCWLAFGFPASASEDRCPAGWLVRPRYGAPVCCAPTRLRVNSIDPMLERAEIDRGFVLLDEVLRLSKVREAGWVPEPARALPAAEAAQLREAAGEAPVTAWFIEGCSFGTESTVTHALPVRA